MTKSTRRRWWGWLAAALLATACGWSQQPALNPALPLTHVEHGANLPAAQRAPYVVLVSLDGFRWDYAARDGAANLLALGKAGAWAPEGMLPSFPSLTFPNHFTLVTGLYPEHHGIVGNSFLDPERGARYAVGDQAAMNDGTWYRGVPLWSLAESQGMRSAVLCWVGAEAEIAGFRPSWYAHFDVKTEATEAAQQARIDNAVALLKLPAADRPHFLAIYLSEPDHEGHQFGPDAAETRAAEKKMDAWVGRLKAALDATGLPINLVVVSDHGMAQVAGGWVTLDRFADLAGFDTAGSLLYAKTEADRERVYQKLKRASPQFMAYRRRDLPHELHADENARLGDPVVVATGPYALRAHTPGAGKPDPAPIPGMHGYDPMRVPQMRASFFAAGPEIKPGKTVAPFENVNIYPFLAHILGLKPAAGDGNLNILAGVLRDNGNDTAESEGR
jgi:alkaline phosphatase D